MSPMIWRTPRYIRRNPIGSERFLGNLRDTGYFGRTAGSTSPNTLLQVGCSGCADGTSDISDTLSIVISEGEGEKKHTKK